MRILVLGKDYASESFFELFQKNKDNIVFSNSQNLKDCVDFSKNADILDFCEANSVNLVLIVDEEYINSGLQELLSEKNISAFSPSIEAIGICSSKASAKKFMYKNKILTPKFAVMEKPFNAFEYIKETNTAQAVKPDNHSYIEGTLFCETYNQAQKIIEKLFLTGNKKIVIEDYIEGKSFSVWTLSDGYSAKILGSCAKYQNDIALFEPDFLTDELKEEIYKNAIAPTINAMSTVEEEYIGILGFDFILSYDNKPYLVGYNSFFDDICVDFFTKGFDVDWAQIFERTIIGDVFLNYKIEPPSDYMLAIRQNEKINFISSKTKNGLKRYLEQLDFDTNLYDEAEKIWKY